MDNFVHGELCIIAMKGMEDFASQVTRWICRSRNILEESVYMTMADEIRFADGEGKCVLHQSMRGKDIFILCDVFNYGVTYMMYGVEQRMSPDDHYQDLKRIIGAIGGKASRITVIMPMLYEGRQDKRSRRESLDCAICLQELISLGVSNIISFDVHNPSVQNAIPLHGFENVHPTYQMLKCLVNTVPDISLDPKDIIVFSPDEGGMSRCVYYSSVLGCDLSMFYKRRDYSKVVNGKNKIIAHEYLGGDITGKDVIVVDDIIASGESMFDVAHRIYEMGAKRIFLFASFGLFTEGLQKADEAYEKGWFTYLYTTNLIYRTAELKSRKWYKEVNICKYVALLVNKLNLDESISELLHNADRIEKLIQAHKLRQQ